MDFGRALSAALLFIITLSALGISQEVPDDVVYTEIKKTLVNGSKGVLTCRFKGTPNAVYWKKGSDAENSPSIITWGYGNKYGPRYDDGSCDIDENYSLIIKDVAYEDKGRYICRVSNYKAFLIHNYTDITVTNFAVKTEQRVLVQKGEVGVLPCKVNMRPRTVSWLRGYNETLVTMDLSRNVIERSELGQFNITKDYALVIYDVAVQHEDEYLCKVADYDTGSTYQDATLLNVYAYPREPFPSIKECPVNSSSSCTLRIRSDMTLTMLTCQVEGYYPHIDLYFVHGSDRVETLEAREWNNSDGTLNKLIEIETGDSGETSFECIATGLVGQEDSGSMSIHLIPDNKQSHIAVAVVVPVIFVFALIITGVLVYKWRKAHSRREYVSVPIVPMVHKQKQGGCISYIEIWMLVKDVFQQNLIKNLAKVLDHLRGDESSSRTLLEQKDYYKELCEWKKEYTGVSQREDFFDACRNQGLEGALETLQKYTNSTREVTTDDLEHTLWYVAESERIIELLEELGALPEQINRLQNKNIKDVIIGTMNILKYWRDVNSSGNQEVMLSLALEKINYSPHDEDFFRIREEQKSGLDKQEIQSFLSSEVTSRHCTVLGKAIEELTGKIPIHEKFFALLKRSKTKDVWLNDIIEKNRSDLFGIHQMIEDWWAEQCCSNYKKRCRLRDAADSLHGQDMQILTEQRKDNKDIRDEKSDGTLYYDLVPRPKGKFIYKAELVDMALDLIVEDFRPLAHALGIKGTRLMSYKRAFYPSHLELGTISLVVQLVKLTEKVYLDTKTRVIVCNILNNAGYRKVTSRFMSASEPSYGELFALEAALTLGDKPKVDLVPHKTTGEIKPTTERSSDNVASNKEQSLSGAATQGDGPTVDVASPSRKRNNVVAKTEESHSMAATHADDGKGDGGTPASPGQSIPDEENDHNVGTDGGQSPSVAGTQGDRRMVDVGSHLSTRYIKTNEQSDSNVGTDSEQSHSEAGTHCVESKDDVSNEPNMPTKVLKSAKESDENVEFKMDHFTSRAAAAPGDETESHCSENLKGEELHTGKDTSMAVDDHETEIGGTSHATGIIKKLRKKNKKVQNRQIPINENKPEKIQTSLQETSVGHGSQETSEEKTPTEKSQSDRKDELLDGHFQETPRSEAALTSVDGKKTETNYFRGTEGSCGKSLDDLQRILGLADEDMPQSSINPVLMMFKIWKERVCPDLIDHRVFLVEGIKKIGKPNVVPALINGGYHTNKTSIEFIEDMLEGIDEHHRNTLRRLLKIEKSKAKDLRSSDELGQVIYDLVANWTKQMQPSTLHQLRDFLPITEKAPGHRDFNDKLVEHGFLDLAREIMNIEQYW